MGNREASSTPGGRGPSGTDTKVEDSTGIGGTLSSAGAALPVIVVWSDASSCAWRLSCESQQYLIRDQHTGLKSKRLMDIVATRRCQTEQEHEMLAKQKLFARALKRSATLAI